MQRYSVIGRTRAQTFSLLPAVGPTVSVLTVLAVQCRLDDAAGPTELLPAGPGGGRAGPPPPQEDEDGGGETTVEEGAAEQQRRGGDQEHEQSFHLTC